MSIQLSDLLEDYPSAMSPGFQTIITAKKEFAELASSANERLPPGRGKYFKNQRFYHRFMRAYDDLLIIDEAGTGKSCSVLGFPEWASKEMEKAKITPLTADQKLAHFKRVIILVKGPTQKNEIRNQLICKCSDGHFETPAVKNALSEKSQKDAITKAIKTAGYTVKTYGKFAKEIAEKYPTREDNARLTEDYSDTIFWIDEAQYLLVTPEDKGKEEKRKLRTYETIWRVFHSAKRCKRFVTTATPTINFTSEFGSLMNLILPENGKIPAGYKYMDAPENDIRVLFPDLPKTIDYHKARADEMAPYFRGQFPKNYNFDNATIQDLEPMLRGRIGYVRALDVGAIPQEQGNLHNTIQTVDGVTYQSQLVIYESIMSDHQTQGYLAVEGVGESGKKSFSTAERQASNFVFPDGYSGNGLTREERDVLKNKRQAVIGGATNAADDELIEQEVEEGAIDESVVSEKRAFRRFVRYEGDSFSATPEFLPYLRDVQSIARLGCKFAVIADKVKNDPGNCFVYSEYVGGSGAVTLALCLEGLGFRRYNESKSMFTGSLSGVVKPVCAGSDKDASGRRVRPDILPHSRGGPLRYALLTKETSDAKFQSIMEAMNSYENRYGDYIKVLISTRVGKEGINVNNVLQIHLVGAEWNQSNMYQALSRGLRATSHDDLLREEQDRLRSIGQDPANATVIVKVYKHAAFTNTEDQRSIDMQMYNMAEYKDRSIKRLMRIMKQVAIGCQVHYSRNVRDKDVDGSPACDYDICKYQCVDPTPTTEDYSTYDVLYSDEIIASAVDDLLNLFAQRNVLTLKEITVQLPEYREKYIIIGLENIISKKIPVLDRFGFVTYLRETNGSFYLDRSYPIGTPNEYAMSYYTNGLIGIQGKKLSAIVSNEEYSSEYKHVEDIINGGSNNLMQKISELSVDGKAMLIEKVVLDYSKGIMRNNTNDIIDLYKYMFFWMHEPLTEIRKAYAAQQNKGTRRGRAPNPNTKHKPKKVVKGAVSDLVLDDDTEIVYLHVVHVFKPRATSYNYVSGYHNADGRLRILKPSENIGWRDLNTIETSIYNPLLQLRIDSVIDRFKEKEIYGSVIDGVFRIADVGKQSEKAKTDTRNVNRGRKCSNYDLKRLKEMMWELQVPLPDDEQYDSMVESPYTRRDLVNIVVSSKGEIKRSEAEIWPFDKLIYFAKMAAYGKEKSDVLCEDIREQLESDNGIAHIDIST